MAYPDESVDRSYPSPGSASNPSLPFYQQLRRQQQLQDGQQQLQRHGNGPESEFPGVEALCAVPDDPEMRESLASMLGNYANFESLPMRVEDLANASSTSALPHGSASSAQTAGSPEDASLSHDKNKDKRTKVSRACDECRRKKIRCDATDESATTPCANCARTGVKCAFSRLPMKRGPSKGYIKELAERLNTLERQVHPPHMQQQHQNEIQQVQQAMAERLHTPAQDIRTFSDARTGEKRSHEVAEALHRRQSPPIAKRIQSGGPSTPNGVETTQHTAYGDLYEARPFWRHNAREHYHHEGGSSLYEQDLNSTASLASFDWDEPVISEYYGLIHQTFPLLPHNKSRLRQQLAECPTSLREAFLVALDCLVRTFPTTKLTPNPNYAVAIKRAAELLAKYPFENPSSHTDATNLVYLQTLLLMAIEGDNHGPATIRGQAGPSRSEWLGRAAGVAGQLEINVIRNTGQSVLQGDRDSQDRLARRAWWVLFILDRWHASSTADLLKLPENSVVLIPEDQILLGESTYHLARLSFIIGHLAAILTTTKTPSTDVMASSNPASALLGLTLAGEIDRFRESVESVWGALNLVHISYHHCHLLMKCLNPATEPVELVGHAVKVATILNSRSTPVTPLNHHFGALAALTLHSLCDVSRTRAEATKGLDQMIDCLDGGRGLAGKLDSQGWDGAVRELVMKRREQMRHLNDTTSTAAVRNSTDGHFDPTMLTRYGYLTSLGQGLFARKTP